MQKQLTNLPPGSITENSFCEEVEDSVERSIYYRGHKFTSFIPTNLIGGSSESATPEELWNKGMLRSYARFKSGTLTAARDINIVDLFSGCGGMAQGVCNAVSFLGMNPVINAAADLDPDALKIYKKNLNPRVVFNKSVTSLIHYHLWSEQGSPCFGSRPTISNELKKYVGKTDILIGGPPCQGHSGFNNHTRGVDDRNKLYLTMPALGVALNASIIIIENVVRITKDKSDVVETTRSILEREGYSVMTTVLSAADFGVAQKRERHFLIASKSSLDSIKDIVDLLKLSPVTVWDAISDLSISENSIIFDSFSNLTDENKTRIDHLFDNNLYDLPDHVRPKCHQNGHTYPSIYGRLKPDSVSNTITTGFMSPGRGRYVHPTLRRCLTPHEAARLQGFSDSFNFKAMDGHYPSLSTLQKVIGDAVPPQLSFVPAFAALLSQYSHE